MVNGYKKIKYLSILLIFLASCVHVDEDKTVSLETSDEWYIPFYDLTVGSHSNFNPSPNGSDLYFTRLEDSRLNIFSLNHSNLSQLTNHKFDTYMPSFSKKGNVFVYISRENDAKGDIVIESRNFLGIKKTKNLSLPDSKEYEPNLSPDGKTLIFSSKSYNGEPISRIYDLKNDAFTSHQISGSQASFSLDGQSITFQRNQNIWQYDLDLNRETQLSFGESLDSFPAFISSNTVVFHRKIDDTNQNHSLDGQDLGSLWTVNINTHQESQLSFNSGNPNQGRLYNDVIVASYEKDRHIQLTTLPISGQFLKRDPADIYKISLQIDQRSTYMDVLFSQNLISIEELLEWHVLHGNYWRISRYKNLDQSGSYADLLKKISRLLQYSPLPLSGIKQKIKVNQICQEFEDSNASKFPMCALNRLLVGLHKSENTTKILNDAVAYLDVQDVHLPILVKMNVAIYELKSRILGQKEAWIGLDHFCAKLEDSYASYMEDELSNIYRGVENIEELVVSSKCNLLKIPFVLNRIQATLKESPELAKSDLLGLLNISKYTPSDYSKILKSLLSIELNKLELESIGKSYLEALPYINKSLLYHDKNLLNSTFMALFKASGDIYRKNFEHGLAVDIYRLGLKFKNDSYTLHKSVIDSYYILGKIDDIVEYYSDNSKSKGLSSAQREYLLLYCRTYDIDKASTPAQRLTIIQDLKPSFESLLTSLKREPALYQTLGWMNMQEYIWKMESDKDYFIGSIRNSLQSLGQFLFGKSDPLLPKSIWYYQNALALLPSNSSERTGLLQNIGESYYYAKNYGQASYYYEQRISSLAPYINSDQELDILIKASIAASQNRNYTVSIQHLERAIVISDHVKNMESKLQIYGRLALLYEDTNNYQKSIESYSYILAASPGNQARILLNRGRIFQKMKNHRAAINDFNLSLKSYQESTDNEKFVSKNIQINLSGESSSSSGFDDDTLKLQTHMLLARSYVATGLYTKGIKALKDKLEIQENGKKSPQLSTKSDIDITINNIAFLYFIEGNYTESELWFSRLSLTKTETKDETNVEAKINDENIEQVRSRQNYLSAQRPLTPDTISRAKKFQIISSSETLDINSNKSTARTELDDSTISFNYLLAEELWADAYKKIKKNPDIDSHIFLPATFDFLKESFQREIASVASVELRYKKYLEYLRVKNNIINYRLVNLKSDPNGNEKSKAIVLENDRAIYSLIQRKQGMELITQTSTSITSTSIDKWDDASEIIKRNSYPYSYILIDDHATELFLKLKKSKVNISLVSDLQQVQKQNYPYLSSLHLIEETEQQAIKHNKDIYPVESASVLHIRKPIEINSSYSNSNFYKAEILETHSSKIVVWENIDLQRINDPKYLLSIDALSQKYGAKSTLFAYEPVNWSEIYVDLDRMVLSDILKKYPLFILGNLGPDLKSLKSLATDKTQMESLNPIDQLFFARLIDDKEKISELVYAMRNARMSEKRFESALSFQKQIMAFITDLESENYVEEQINLLIINIEIGNFAEAELIIKECLDKTTTLESLSLKAKVLRIAAIAYEKQKKYQQGLDSLKLAVELTKDDSFEQVEHLLNYANYLREYFQNYRDAIPQYKKAIQIFAEYEDLEGILRATIDLAISYVDIGSIESAIGILESYYNQSSDLTLTTKIRLRLALMNAYHRGGYFGKIQSILDNIDPLVLELKKSSNTNSLEIDILNIKGLMLGKLHKNDESKAAFNDAITQATKSNLQRKIALSHSNLGFVLRDFNDLGSSLKHFKIALSYDEKEKDQRGIAFSYRNLGLSYLASKDFVESRIWLTKSLELSEALNLSYNVSYSLLGLAELDFLDKNYQNAYTILDRALAISRKNGFQDFIWRILSAKALNMQKSGNSKRAMEHFLEALESIENLRSSLGNKEYKSSFQADKSVQSVYEDFVLFLVEIGNYEMAWEISERSRSRSFADSLSDSQLKDAPSEFVTIKSLQSKLSEPLESEERLAILKQIDTMGAILRKTKPKFFELLKPSPLSLKDVQSKLNAKTAIVEYMVTKEKLLTWIIRHNSLKLVSKDINTANLDEDVQLYRKALMELRSTESIGRRISALLIDDIWSDIESATAIGVVPHSSLHFFPFSAILVGDKYFIEQKDIFYLESASLISYTFGYPLKTENINVIALGNPDRGKDLALPFAQKEAEVIQRYFPHANVKTGINANEDSIYENAKSDVIHVASHGAFDIVNPSHSKILLSESKENDGYFTVDDILNSNFSANLFALSACETGLGQISRGDEIVSFNRALFLSGAKSIVSTLWRINDVASAIIMKRFYRSLSEGESKVSALRTAQLSAKQYFPHPAYWSSFRLIGSPD